MDAKEVRNRVRTRVEQWHATLEHLKAERKQATGEVRRRYVEDLRAMQASVAEEVQKWNAGIDAYDMDPARTTQREFDERASLREIEGQIKAEMALWLSETHDVG